MKYAYDESYLEDVQKNLGFFFQFLLCNEKMPPEEVQRLFLSSEIPYQIEIGNPDFLCGKSGFELAILALKDKDLSLSISINSIYLVSIKFFPLTSITLTAYPLSLITLTLILSVIV